MIRLALRTFVDRWQLFVGTVLAVTAGVAIVHAGMTIILGVENSEAPAGASVEQAEACQEAVSATGTLTGMTVTLGAFLTIFVVGSTFGFAVDQRRRDLAVLRLGGVTAKQIRGLLLAEGCVAAVLGTLAGAVLGTGLTTVQRALLSGLGVFPDGAATPVRTAVLVIDLVVAFTVCFLGARGTAKRATRLKPLDALRRTADEQRVMTVRRWIVAVTALVLTALQTYVAAAGGGLLLTILLGLGIIITGSVATSRLAPLLVPAAAGVLTAWARRSVVVEVGVANLRDSVRRTASCAAPMIVLVGLVMGLQGILDTQSKATVVEAETLLAADLVATGDSIDLAAVNAIEGVALAAPETVISPEIQLTTGRTTTPGLGTVVAVDPDAFRATHLQRPDTGDLSDFGQRSVVFGPGLDSTSVSSHYDEITLDVGNDTVRLDEAARMSETLAGVDGFYVDRSVLPAEMLEGPTSVLIQLAGDADRDVVEQSLAAAGATSVLTPSESAVEQTSASEAENRAVMAAIVGLGSLYALISVLSTVAISIGQRRSELATLRLSGLTRQQIHGATVLEALAATTIGLVLGAITAVLALVGIWAATERVYGTAVVAIPWGLLAAMTVLTAALTTVTALLATRSALRLPAIRALGALD
ncbi:FtsX-like permease family protein [Nocardioides yefusunii]|uniref:FtsX-like permease family protein n=1 Tax=Nocardioides yefusunii TaxID=2500546 RepID=A0ABW1QUD2_9ACTN|nr:FtsX-like permease family protein [Nocardioides yefusunii]